MEFSRSNNESGSRGRRSGDRRGEGNRGERSRDFAAQSHQEVPSSSEVPNDTRERIKSMKLLKDLLVLKCWVNGCLRYIQEHHTPKTSKKYLDAVKGFANETNNIEPLLEPLKQVVISLHSGGSYQDLKISQPISDARYAFDNLNRKENSFRSHLRLVGIDKSTVDQIHQWSVRLIEEQLGSK